MGGGGAPQDIKSVIGLRIDEKVGYHCSRELSNSICRFLGFIESVRYARSHNLLHKLDHYDRTYIDRIGKTII